VICLIVIDVFFWYCKIILFNRVFFFFFLYGLDLG
jgi:hypothetical protein